MSPGRRLPKCASLVVLVGLFGFAGCGSPDRGSAAWGGNRPTQDDGEPQTEDGGDDLDDGDASPGSLTAADDDHGGGPGEDDGSGSAAGDGRPDDDGDDDDDDDDDDDGHAEGGGDDGGPPPPDCPPECYCEPIDPEADVADVQAAFNGSNWAESMIEVLRRRWPAGEALFIDRLANDSWFGNFADTSSWGGLMDSMMTEAHEGTHGWDYDAAFGQDTFGYWMREDLTFHLPKLEGFPRSEIYAMVEGNATDLYKDLYLTGTQGTYAWYELLDEGNAYINGMGGIGVVGEFIPWGTSGRDGAVAFLYYASLYLQRARTMYPDLYEQLKSSEYPEFLKVQWLRTHFLMIYAADLHPDLGIADDEIEQLLYADENQVEIEMFIDHELEASNCLP